VASFATSYGQSSVSTGNGTATTGGGGGATGFAATGTGSAAVGSAAGSAAGGRSLQVLCPPNDLGAYETELAGSDLGCAQ
jgi:hypothetical protein